MRNLNAKILLQTLIVWTLIVTVWLAAGLFGYRDSYPLFLHCILGLITFPFIAANAIVVLLIIDEYRGIGRRERWRREGKCYECGYDLKGNVSGICPECGTKTPQPESPDDVKSE